MAEIPNQKIVDRYKELLANRTHDVILRDAALEILEAEVTSLKQETQTLSEENGTLKRKILNQDERILKLLDAQNKDNPPVIQGEVVDES